MTIPDSYKKTLILGQGLFLAAVIIAMTDFVPSWRIYSATVEVSLLAASMFVLRSCFTAQNEGLKTFAAMTWFFSICLAGQALWYIVNRSGGH